MNEAFFEGIRSWLHEFTAPDDERRDEVDTEYLSGEKVNYRYMTVKNSDVVRCDLCGKLEDLSDMPEMFEHVGQHNDDGAAEIDPAEVSPIRDLADLTRDEIKITDDLPHGET